MERDLTERALRPAWLGALGLGTALAVGTSRPIAGGFLAGALWNVLSLALLKALAQAWAREEGRRALRWLLVKLLVLYPVGLWLALSGVYSLVAMIVGFSWVFIVVIGIALLSARPLRHVGVGVHRG